MNKKPPLSKGNNGKNGGWDNWDNNDSFRSSTDMRWNQSATDFRVSGARGAPDKSKSLGDIYLRYQLEASAANKEFFSAKRMADNESKLEGLSTGPAPRSNRQTGGGDVLSVMPERFQRLTLLPSSAANVFRQEPWRSFQRNVTVCLADASCPSYKKAVAVLDTVSRVRSSLVMLDLECDDLILKMFRQFLKIISYRRRSIHGFARNSLAIVKKKQAMMAHRWLRGLWRRFSLVAIVRSWIMDVLKSTVTSLDMYSPVVLAIYQGKAEAHIVV